ncbi:MAG TPA: T9SS type A sorting domain-containing protein [Bacteroidales bacterium]|nr:T9SS type A sorting domain-containing protein [Bacteroidales bacterium]
MRRSFLLLSGLIFLLSLSDISAQRLINRSLFTGSTYASDKVNRIYIPPPPEFFKQTKGGAAVNINFEGFPLFAKDAITYAASILSSILPSGAVIDVNANWINITTSGVLGNSSASAYAIGWGIDAWQPVAIYPVALAEKIAGEPLNEPFTGDIDLNLNSSANWYYGTDGNTPTLKYDLVTVALHEMIHGLGFFDSYYVESSTGSYGASGIPMIYDIFVENIDGHNLTDTLIFSNPSPELKTQITGGSLWFDGPVVRAATGGQRARIYAPSEYDPGSSIAHLDEDTYNSSNALMTPFISRGEALHNPGPIVRAMLGEMGWINTRIIHEPLPDTEENISSLAINVEIESDTAYNQNNVILTWSSDNFATSNEILMNFPGSGDSYSATIPVPSYETRIDYFFTAEDHFLRQYVSPSDTAFPYTVFVGTDTVKPVILHTPAEYYLSVIDSISLFADAADNIDVDTVYVEFRINEGISSFAGMNKTGKYQYKTVIDAAELPFSGGDSLQYRIIATDRASSPNIRILPMEGWFTVDFILINPVAESYTTDFSGANNDFLNNGFEITIPAGFSDFGLHTRHPYESPEETGDSIGYTALLRTPLRFDDSGMIISFDEVVLVEPGEEGSLFGSIYFYDYVIIEGSPDYGKTWIALTDGYDSRYMDSWLRDYNSSIDDMNSTFAGKESMLVKHTIYLSTSQFFNDGDIILLRFRLFSDPYANGWGWVIQNLHAGPLINSIEEIRSGTFAVYPNPGNGTFTLRSSLPHTYLSYNIISAGGVNLLKGDIEAKEEIQVDISQFPAGIYFIVMDNGKEQQVLKYNLVR